MQIFATPSRNGLFCNAGLNASTLCRLVVLLGGSAIDKAVVNGGPFVAFLKSKPGQIHLDASFSRV